MSKSAQIKEAKAFFKTRPLNPQAVEAYLSCQDQEIRLLAEEYERKKEAESQRLSAMLSYERAGWQKQCLYIAGLDEVGRGPLAGPVVVAAVILPDDLDFLQLWDLNDSKKLSSKKREALAVKIQAHALSWSIAWQSARKIEKEGIVSAIKSSMLKAIAQLSIAPQHLLLDAVYLEDYPSDFQDNIIKGDQKSLSIAAASILAKCWRDRLMTIAHQKYPVYNFAQNKGYGTEEHCRALLKYGPCPLHRANFIEKIIIPQEEMLF